jgi:EAL domain-containing protein (putative c-di-GMP-specific phosphodiesterase class I)
MDILRIGRQLIKKNHINVVFQPIISLLGTTDEIFEVQMAVDKDAFAEGEIPHDFIAQVFKTEIGRELDRTAVTHALERLKAKKLTAPVTKLCFNLSQSTITDDKFIPWLQKTLERLDIQPRDLIFQMREIDVTHHMGDVAKMFDRLKSLGVATGLTHYGLAINPATLFNRIKVDFVKVDGTISAKAQKEKPPWRP